jgi:diguanylate cyclase (GGDEF)-like protein
MAILLLAFDFIAPMIGGVVIAGTVSFLGGVLLARRSSLELESTLGDRFVPLLEAEIERLHQERIQNELEDELFSQFASHRNVSSALWALLGQIVPQPSSGFVAILGTDATPHCPKMARGLTEQSFEQMTLPDELLYRLKSQNPLAIQKDPDVYGLFERLDVVDRDKTSTLYLTALEDGQETFGVLVTSELWPQGLPESEQRLFMKRVARRIGKRCQQIHFSEQQTNELRLTQDMLELRAIADAPHNEPLETLTRFAKRLLDSTHADRVAVYFVARRMGEQLRPVVQCGQPLTPAEQSAWDRHERALACIAIESGVGSLHDGHLHQNWPGDSPIASAATMPIRVNGGVLGSLCVTRRGLGHSLENNWKLIEFGTETLSKTIGRVFEEASIRRQARHDHLTDLVNRRSFDAYVTTEVERIRLGESPTCSLIFADLDHFKSINDTHGHQAGDHVLREAARILTERVSRLRMGERSIVARYGGEEFAILLPGVGLAGTTRIAEGIRAAIESEVILIKDVRLNITASLGVAVCPDQATSVESLIAFADKALYQAKSKGRNCVCYVDDVAK